MKKKPNHTFYRIAKRCYWRGDDLQWFYLILLADLGNV